MQKKFFLLWLIFLTPLFLIAQVTLNSSPTLSFKFNSTAITSDHIASDGESGSDDISGIEIQIYNISNTSGTLSPTLSWSDNIFLFSSDSSYSGLTNQMNSGSKGMAIKSADGSEFHLMKFVYYNWGEGTAFTNTVKGYRNGSEVASTTFEGHNPQYLPMTITLPTSFENVDEVRFYISAGGYMGNQSATNHSINHIQVSSPVVACTAPTITGNPPNRSICPGNNTTFSASAIGTAITYQWQMNSGSGFIDINNGGVYSNATTSTLTITGATAAMNGYMYRCKLMSGTCVAYSNSGNLNISNIVTFSSQYNVSCFNGSNGAAAVSPEGGIGSYTYSWAPTGGTSSVATGLSAGTYTCTITDAIGCQTTKTVTITQPASSLVASIQGQTNVSCFGGSNGTATVSAIGGTPGYSYSWAPSGGTGATATGLSAGTYTVTITDANMCQTTQSFTITQPASAVSGTTVVTNVSCNGSNNGAINLTPTGGTPPYTYNWGGGITTKDRTNLVAGNYSVTITDANSCVGMVNVTINQPNSLLSGTTVVTNVSCNGGNNGAINLTPTGGTPPYTYNWGGGITTKDRTNLVAANYSVTITDANGCTKILNIPVFQPASPVTGTVVITNVSCNGASNGVINLTPSGGTGPYTFDWSDGVTTEDRTGRAAGSYSVTITDANGCSAIKNFTVLQPIALVASAGSKTNVSCNGGSNGSATVNVTGGTPGYTYSWAPSGGTAATATGLSAGMYTVTVTDANGCTATQNFTITQPTTLVASPSAQTNIACNGGSNGSATVNVSGGTPGYTYSWAPTGGTAAKATGLTAGTYTVTVTDANGCIATQSFTITQPTTLVASMGAQTNIACNGGSNGSATVNVTGGIPEYTYSWAPSGGTAATATGLSAGTYTVTVTDANGCIATQSFNIVQPTALVATVGSQTNVSCNGGSNGSATVNVAGGIAGYTYSWAPTGGTAATATGLSAGTYTVTVTDANMCQTTQSFTITEPAALVASAGSKTNVSCNGGSNGSATVNVAGGTGEYTYSWAPSGSTAATATGLSAGTYTVTITDANMCQTTQSFTITEPSALVASAGSKTNVSCNGGSDGSATVNVAGGTPGYTYSWAPSGGTAATATGLTAGIYTVTVTDANGCIATQSFTIVQPTALVASMGAQTNIACNGGSNGSVTVNVTGGIPGYTYSWAPSGGTAATATGLSAGTYTVTVTDANGCVATQSFNIVEPTALIAIVGTQANVSCNGGSNGSATVNVAGGTTGYTYSWAPTGGTATTATGLSAGTYTVTVTDANMCQTTQSFTITEPTALVTTIGAQTNVSCNGGSNGSATVNVAGGTPGYTYSWAPTGGTAATASGLSAGTYTVTVTDANGCMTTQNVTITEPATLIATVGTQTNVSCNSGSNGSATVNVAGGIAGYTYSWAPSGGTAATATGLSAGTYTVTVTDANGCIATQSFTIVQPTALVASMGAQTNIACNGGSNGSATVNVTGGIPGYTYSWAPSGGTAATATGLSAGTYTVTVTDANGCVATQSFNIVEPTALIAIVGTQTNVSCNGGSNGSATVNVAGGTTGYTYSWAPTGGTAATATGLSAGTYTVTVTDANMCQTTQSFTITEPTALVTTIGAQTNVSCNGGSNGSATVNVAGGTPGYTYSWAPTGGTAATASGLSAGTYTVTVTDANGCMTTQNVTITEPATLIATVGAQTNVSCNSGSNGSATVNVAGGIAGYTYSWAPSGGTAATATGLSAGTYTVTVTDANGCIATQSFMISQPTALSFTTTTLPGYDYNVTYNETVEVTGGTGTKTFTVTAGNLPSGFVLNADGSIEGTSTQVADSNFTITATDENNCTTSQNFVLKLNQIPVTVTAIASQTKVYGQNDPVFEYTVVPELLSGDNFTGNLSRDAGENIGNYTINQGTLSGGDKYLITYVSKDFTITAKPITITPDASQTKVYGTTDPVFAYSVAPGLVESDVLTGDLTRVAGEDVGTFAIEQGSLSASDNYIVTYVSNDFAITAKPITVTADASQTKVYGTTDPDFSYSVAPGLVGSDAFTGALTRTAGENVGLYEITQGSLNAGSNYTINYISNDFAITVKSINVTADASQTKVYGTTDPVYSYSVIPDLIGGDAFTGALERTAGENVGTYEITLGSLSAGTNYTINYLSNDFTITAKLINVIADASQTKVYGTTDPVFTYSVTPDLLGNDTFTGALTRTPGEDVGLYEITQGNLSAGTNYTIAYTSSDFSITKADQIITWNQTLALGCDGETTIVLTAVSSSDLTVSYASSNNEVATISDDLLIFQNYGSANIIASQEGNMNYNPATVVVLPIVNSQPNLIRKQFEDIIFFDNSSKNFKAYSWYKNDVLVPSQTSQYFKENGPLNGTYHAVATKLDGTLITTCPLTLSPTLEEEYIKIAPNPVRSNGNFQLTTNISSDQLQNARIELFDVTGSLLMSMNTNQNTIDLQAPNAEGIYILKLTLADGKYFTKNLLVKN